MNNTYKKISDEFQTLSKDAIINIANGNQLIKEIASQELANRGLDSHGVWVGFNKAKKLHHERINKTSTALDEGEDI